MKSTVVANGLNKIPEARELLAASVGAKGNSAVLMAHNLGNGIFGNIGMAHGCNCATPQAVKVNAVAARYWVNIYQAKAPSHVCEQLRDTPAALAFYSTGLQRWP